MVDGIEADGGPDERRGHPIAHPQPHPFADEPAAMGPDLGDDVATRSDQVGDAAQESYGIAADAEIAIGEERAVPAALAGHGGEDIAADRDCSPAARLPNRLDRHVDAHRGNAPGHQRRGQPARAAADVEGRAAAGIDEQLKVQVVGLVTPWLDREEPGRATAIDEMAVLAGEGPIHREDRVEIVHRHRASATTAEARRCG